MNDIDNGINEKEDSRWEQDPHCMLLPLDLSCIIVENTADQEKERKMKCLNVFLDKGVFAIQVSKNDQKSGENLPKIQPVYSIDGGDGFGAIKRIHSDIKDSYRW